MAAALRGKWRGRDRKRETVMEGAKESVSEGDGPGALHSALSLT